MRRTMLAAVSATALSIGLVAAGSAPVMAQAAEGGLFGMLGAENATMLEDMIRTDLAQIGIDEEVNVNALTVEQLSQIMLVMNRDEGSEEEKRTEIQNILGMQ